MSAISGLQDQINGFGTGRYIFPLYFIFFLENVYHMLALDGYSFGGCVPYFKTKLISKSPHISKETNLWHLIRVVSATHSLNNLTIFWKLQNTNPFTILWIECKISQLQVISLVYFDLSRSNMVLLQNTQLTDFSLFFFSKGSSVFLMWRTNYLYLDFLKNVGI